jgi:hypothetical protein
MFLHLRLHIHVIVVIRFLLLGVNSSTLGMLFIVTAKNIILLCTADAVGSERIQKGDDVLKFVGALGCIAINMCM